MNEIGKREREERGKIKLYIRLIILSQGKRDVEERYN